MWRALRDRARGDSTGGVIVLAALVLPVAILFCGFVIDVANWFEHKRHLQTQADAAALAGAGSFLACPNNDPIVEKTEEYGGATWNAQIGDTQGSVDMEINSETYPGQSGFVDTTVVEEPPCEAEMVDVKLTETDLPWWFELGDVDFINAHARVEFKEVEEMAGLMPFGVPDVKPLAGRVWFINDETGQTLTAGDGSPATAPLTRKLYSGGAAYWDNLDATVDVTLPDDAPEHIGVRVALSGSTSTTCGAPLVECYDLGSEHGILHARTWSPDAAGPTAPRAHHVGLTQTVQGGCPNAYFHETPAAGCNVGVQAQIDLGGGLASDYDIDAVVGNKRYALEPTTGNNWASSQLIPVTPAAGPVNISLDWKAGRNSGSFGMVQRTFSASARSGPIKTAVLSANGASPVSSLEQCSAARLDCTYSLAVQLGIQGSFEDIYRDLASITDPVTLRVGGDSGSQTQALDCDPWREDSTDPDFKLPNGQRSLLAEIALGCRPRYTDNAGTTCPSSLSELQGTSTSVDDQGAAWQCVGVQTGQTPNKIDTGLNLRILGAANPTTCTRPNNWNEDTRAPDPASAGDPRIIHLFLTQFGIFDQNQGSDDLVPVTGFATFYVTDWRGQGGGTNPCRAVGDPIPEAGTVVGHFWQYRGALGDNTGTEPCDFDGPTPCVFALTR